MPVRFEFGWVEVGNTVPYPPSQERIRRGLKRTNMGFVDLRGRPDSAAGVAEAARSPELAAWLVDLAQPGSALFSLGCDIGTHVERPAGKKPRHATGGYVQLLAADYARWAEAEYKAVAETWAARVESAAGDDEWDLAFLLQVVQFNLDGVNDEILSLSVDFNAWAANPAAAGRSRERLIKTIRSEFPGALQAPQPPGMR